MGIEVDFGRLAKRFRLMRRHYGYPTFDLWVQLDGVDRVECCRVVRAAWEPLHGKYKVVVYPTSGGATIRSGGRDWRERVEKLASRLEADGYTGRIVEPLAPIIEVPNTTVCQMLYMAHTQVPPIEEGPFSEIGFPLYRWSVPEPANTRLLDRMIDWTLGREGVGLVESLPPVWVTVEDARDVMGVREPYDNGIAAVSEDRTWIPRAVNRLEWGQSLWANADPSTSLVERAHALTGVLREFAADLDSAVIRPAQFSPPMNANFHFWGSDPHLWNQYVPDACGIQLVTGSTLAKANDLTNWQVEQVSEDRYLITAPNLEDWLDCNDARALWSRQFPDPDLQAQARADFGDMILTRAVRDAHPVRPEPDQLD